MLAYLLKPTEYLVLGRYTSTPVPSVIDWFLAPFFFVTHVYCRYLILELRLNIIFSIFAINKINKIIVQLNIIPV